MLIVEPGRAYNCIGTIGREILKEIVWKEYRRRALPLPR